MKKYIITHFMHRREFLKNAAVFLLLAQSSAGHAQAFSDKNDGMDTHVKDRLPGKRDFNRTYPEDICLEKNEFPLLLSTASRLNRIRKIVGYGNFSLISFDHALAVAKNYSRVGSFPEPELEFLEKLFYSQVREYGFMGEKTLKSITVQIRKNNVQKISSTGHYLYRGKPMAVYEKIRKEVGPELVLTSGVRGIVKQFSLFLNKTCETGGNLSMASRSLAPPGYSFHGIGDFDVGEKGFGRLNFTEKFTQTRVYQKLIGLGYMKFRYERGNQLGVRFEPWHIEAS